MTPAERNARAMTLLQLALILQCAPERPVLWTDQERAVRDEYDRRLAPRVAA